MAAAIVGLILLWISDVWNTRDKLIGTFLVPFGLASTLLAGVMTAAVGSGNVCVSSLEEVSPTIRLGVSGIPDLVPDGLR